LVLSALLIFKVALPVLVPQGRILSTDLMRRTAWCASAQDRAQHPVIDPDLLGLPPLLSGRGVRYAGVALAPRGFADANGINV